MIVLGLNAYHADASACLLRDGALLAAAEEERFRRIKHWAGFPQEAIRYCLREAGLRLGDVAHVAVRGRRGGAGGLLSGRAVGGQVHEIEHHLAHLGSAFLVSPFDEAAAVSVDGFGDFASAGWGVGRGDAVGASTPLPSTWIYPMAFDAITTLWSNTPYGAGDPGI